MYDQHGSVILLEFLLSSETEEVSSTCLISVSFDRAAASLKVHSFASLLGNDVVVWNE